MAAGCAAAGDRRVLAGEALLGPGGIELVDVYGAGADGSIDEEDQGSLGNSAAGRNRGEVELHVSGGGAINRNERGRAVVLLRGELVGKGICRGWRLCHQGRSGKCKGNKGSGNDTEQTAQSGQTHY